MTKLSSTCIVISHFMSRIIGIGAAWVLIVGICCSHIAMATNRMALGRHVTADIQCLAVGARLAGSKSARLKTAGTMLTYYFLGRIDGEAPRVNLVRLIEEQTEHMSASEFKKTVGRCGAEFAMRGRQIARIGEMLEKKRT